ncbi:MAG: YoaK family protein [Ferruginibacter sp.]
MFRHKGKSRTYIHNLRLASLLSLVAGMVNVTGVLSVNILTTNVTGHFAYFAEDISKKNYEIAFVFLFFILSFLLGSFTSNFIIEFVSRRKPQHAYTLPIAIEILILISVGILGSNFLLSKFDGYMIGCFLLFAMGLQNSLVTKASQSVVRTTHLTGLFTDLGIELSQLFFYRKTSEFHQLSKSIYLKLAIIGCFFLGCIAGGFVYRSLEMKTLLIAAVFLVIAFFYDHLRFQYYQLKRRVQAR